MSRATPRYCTFRNTSRHASNKEVSGGTYNSKQLAPYVGMQPPLTVEGAVGLLLFCPSYLNHVQLAKGLEIWMVKGANPFDIILNVSTNIKQRVDTCYRYQFHEHIVTATLLTWAELRYEMIDYHNKCHYKP
jgi:hypothetical protein